MNRSEEITYNLCKKSFLSLWSYANPWRAKGKEFCDVLVVFHPHVVIISVREIRYDDSANETVALKRWQRRAIEESVRKIYNAEKWIMLNRTVLNGNMKPIAIPDLKMARIHRVAVALGSRRLVPVGSGDFGKGYVHVHDEISFHLMLQELDTITDFVDYLTSVESLLSGGVRIILNGGQEDLLALYLENNRSLPGKANVLVIDERVWKDFDRRPEVKRRREEDKLSYLWDFIIEELSRSAKNGTLECESNPRETELVLRTMAGEDRFNRRILSQQIDDVLRNTPKTHRRAKVMESSSGILYVLLVSERGRDREDRRTELELRCYAARNIFRSSPIVVGMATEHYDPAGHSFDACYLRFDKWTKEDEKRALEIKEKLGYFVKAQSKQLHFDEYPMTGKSDVHTTAKATTAHDLRIEKLQILQQRFPLTLSRLKQTPEFDILGRQLTLEGYEDWEIFQAACNIVLFYSFEPEGKKTPDLTNKLPEYIENCVETAYSPFPPTDHFTLKKVRNQIHADRMARLARSGVHVRETNNGMFTKQVLEDREPQNCLNGRSRDNFDLWMILFPKLVPGKERLSISEEWKIRVGCDSTDTVAFRFCADLAHDLAKYATMIDYWVSELDSTRKAELNIAVVEERLFKKLFTDSYAKALEGRAEIGSVPIIMSWRDDEGKPHIKFGINELILQQPRMKRLFYAMCGILDCIGGLQKPDAARKAAQLVQTLE